MIPIPHIYVDLSFKLILFFHVIRMETDIINIMQYEIKALNAHMYALGTKSRLN